MFCNMITDKKGNAIRVGDCVIWHDPDEETRDLTRILAVDKINGDDEDSIILISDEYGSEAEVWGCELELF